MLRASSTLLRWEIMWTRPAPAVRESCVWWVLQSSFDFAYVSPLERHLSFGNFFPSETLLQFATFSLSELSKGRKAEG